MLGAIVGDIVGSRFEFNNTHRTDFELFTPECGFTDDTVCTVAVADALLRGVDFGPTLHSWCRRYANPMGAYGGRFRQWVASDDPQPYFSFGNGSGMRVSPCGWVDGPMDDVLEAARQSAACTHNHPEGIKGAQCIAECIRTLRDGGGREAVRAVATTRYGYDVSETCDEIRRTNRFDETCQVTVPQSIVCFLESTDFEQAVRLAISIGGDSDTIAAMTGSLAEGILWKHTSSRILRLTSGRHASFRTTNRAPRAAYCAVCTINWHPTHRLSWCA